MKHFLRQTDEVIKWNLRQLVVFVILYRLAAGIFYIRAVNGLLRFSLSMAGYSYLTLGNLGAFLWHPFTLPCVALALMGGMVLVTVETAGLVTAFQASAYSRKMDLLGILGGAAVNTWDQIRRRNWQIFVASLGNYILMNSYLLARLLTKVKPVDFVLEEVLNLPAARLGLVILMTVLSAAAVPSMLVFWACMVEQKRFRDGLRRSMELLKGRWIKAVGALVCVNVLLMGGLVLLYGAAMALAAVLVTLFADSYAALAVLTAVCGKAEIILLFAGGCICGHSGFRRSDRSVLPFFPKQAGTGGFGQTISGAPPDGSFHAHRAGTAGDHAEVAALIFRRTCGNSSVFNF